MGERMDITGAARLLGSPESTVVRWARQGLLPCRGSYPELRFERSALERWARGTGMRGRAGQAARVDYQDDLLAAGILRGAVGSAQPTDAAKAIGFAVNQLKDLPEEARLEIIDAVMERERMASTGLGRGVALPHPRRPVERWIKEPRLSVLFLEESLDWAAIDGQPVSTVLLLLSPSVPMHLELLARVSLALHDSTLVELLRSAPDAAALLERVRVIHRED
ncbi:MAG: hypothetical protein CMJ86_04995 [Planctomycetes bacterium]|jgi:PTS system nitrogen regulatory IIA component|nr:hypothetical protein [Planctomycetota bacterium]